ncbi:MAG: hypothetical protein Q9219_007007 [cf. Caloplaca sp. 3 TL-2023]
MSQASSSSPATTTLFSLLTALVAVRPEQDYTPTYTSVPGVVLIESPNKSYSAYTTKDGPTTYFTATNLSPALILLLQEAPIVSWKKKAGRNDGSEHKSYKAGVYLDDLPAGIPRPKLTRVKAVAEAVVTSAVPVTAADSTATVAVETKARKPGRKARELSRVPKKEEKTEAAPATLASASTAAATATAAMAPTTATARPKGLEIDMVEGTFAAVGGRGSRPKKRPARFDAGAEEVALKKPKKANK